MIHKLRYVPKCVVVYGMHWMMVVMFVLIGIARCVISIDSTMYGYIDTDI